MGDDLVGSGMLDGTRRARRLPHPALAITLAVLFDVAPLALLVVIDAADVLPDALVPSALAQTAVLSAVYGLYIVQVWAWVVLWEGRPLSTLGLHGGGAARKLLRGASLGAGVYLLLISLLVALGMVELRSDPLAGPGWAVVLAAGLALAGWAVQGPAEEILYRGWLLPVVTVRSRLRWGIAASTGIFALTHLLGNPFDVMLLVNLALFGVFFACWALREGGLWGVFGWHATVNWVSENLVVVGEGFGVGPLANGLLLGLEETGPDLLTGGAIGLESSLLTTVLLLAGITLLGRGLLEGRRTDAQSNRRPARRGHQKARR